MGAFDLLRRIYFRGRLTSCNYSCDYCPFAKCATDSSGLAADKKELAMFYRFMRDQRWAEPIAVMMTPYGEGMCHEYYWQSLEALARLPQVRAVGIQTNLSFDLNRFLVTVSSDRQVLDKIKFWATCHPTQIALETFAAQANQVAKALDLSVGLVALPEQEEQILRLRSLLHPSIYLWLNAHERRKPAYSADCIRRFQEVDPCFDYEFTAGREQAEAIRQEICQAGKESLLWAAGRLWACHFRVGRGNYRQMTVNCTPDRRCDCFLGYSQMTSGRLARFLGRSLPFRIPEKHFFSALFLDVDGTLTDKDGRLQKGIRPVLEYLATSSHLYLATARSQTSARKICRDIWPLLAGGVFSGGAQVVDGRSGQVQVHDLTSSLAELREAVALNLQRDYLPDGRLLRLFWPQGAERGQRLPAGMQRVSLGQRVSWQHERASKLSGIRQILQWNHWQEQTVLVMTNNREDIPLLTAFPFTVAPLTAPERVKKAAWLILSVNQLPLVVKKGCNKQH